MFGLLLSTVVAATTQAVLVPPAPSAADSRPDRMICERVEELGSRLNSHRVCMLRSQWQEQRRENKMQIDRAQVQQQLNTGK